MVDETLDHPDPNGPELSICCAGTIARLRE